MNIGMGFIVYCRKFSLFPFFSLHYHIKVFKPIAKLVSK